MTTHTQMLTTQLRIEQESPTLILEFVFPEIPLLWAIVSSLRQPRRRGNHLQSGLNFYLMGRNFTGNTPDYWVKVDTILVSLQLIVEVKATDFF
ncbi:hypothetical protein M0812_07241 [Anaeramoeba flamelloides]|uniref:Uncharacterized protein n=1 Tax=Anaeramoeba flamelloides TaxID=1746091 RepID=A0AAV8AFS2_9EUKA|nr:hypothetical protein M0812_07241 [Anaeramoeba flamelloides]